MIERAEFDFDTVIEARENIASMVDMDTCEGRRQFEGLMREARIRERDVEGNGAGSRIQLAQGIVTMRDTNGIECEVETALGPRLLNFQTPLGLEGDRVEVVLIREAARLSA